MPALTNKQLPIQVAEDVLRLPGDVPEFPLEAFTQGVDYVRRAKSLTEWNENNQRWWKTVSAKLTQNTQNTATVINQGTSSGFKNLKAQFDLLTARVNQIDTATASAEEALARRIVTVSAIASKSSNISVQSVPPGSPLVNDYWVDTSDLLNPITYFWSGTDWVEQVEPLSIAAVSEEQTARVTADGFLSGKYTLAVIAGDVVTGMNITSSSGGGTTVSSVTFRATDFKIYNGVTGVTMFVVSGSTVTLGNTLVVDSTGSKVYIGTGTYAATNTPVYLDSVGKFSLGTQLTWDGTTLSISGGAVTTVDWNTQITGRPGELTDGRIAAALDAAGLVISGAHPGINVTTGAAGLYLGADFLGYYNGSSWKTYMDNAGNFYLGGTGGALQWNGTNLLITGSFTVTGGNAAKVDFSNVTAGYAGSPTVGGAANTIVSQGALATLSSASWTTQVSSRPTELTDGRIPTAINSAGVIVSGVKPGIVVSASGIAGLYLGSDFLGYYNGSAWKTYMDNSGNFYLGGTSGSLQWNGTNLSITGSVTITGGNAAKVDFSNVTAGYAGSPTVGGAANTIVSQGALATLSAAAWGSQVSGRPTELTDGRIPTAINSAGLVVSGVKPGIVVSASGVAGLYLGSDFLGYYNGSAWKTYMDNSGNFYLGGTSGALQWNGTTLTVSGVINVTSISGLNYAGAGSPGGAASSLVGQAATATSSDFAVITGATKPSDNATVGAAWGSNLTGRPTELTDGRITTALNSSGLVVSGVRPGINVTTGSAGLYLGADFMGYYNGSAWRTYMDSSGNFYLGGTSGALQWNGSTLTIDGNGTFSGSLSAATGSFAGSLSGATGTFSGSLSAASGTFTGSLSGATGSFSGSLTVGSGGNTVNLSTSGAVFGDPSDVNWTFANNGGSIAALTLRYGGTILAQWLAGPGVNSLQLGSTGSASGASCDFTNGTFTDLYGHGGTLGINGSINFPGSLNAISCTSIVVTAFGPISTSGLITGGSLSVGGSGFIFGDLIMSGTLSPGAIDGNSGGYTVGLSDGSNSISFKYDGGLDLAVIRVGATDFINVRAGGYTGSTVTHDGYVEMKDSGGTTRKFMIGS